MSVIVVLYCILVDLLLLSPSIEPVILHGDRIGVTMATGIPLQPPESFNFQTPDEWPRWRKHFEQFRIASGLGAKSQEQQVNTLLYCLGKEADDVLTSTALPWTKGKAIPKSSQNLMVFLQSAKTLFSNEQCSIDDNKQREKLQGNTSWPCTTWLATATTVNFKTK